MLDLLLIAESFRKFDAIAVVHDVANLKLVSECIMALEFEMAKGVETASAVEWT